MKKIVTLMLVVALICAVFLSACAAPEPVATPVATPEPAATSEATPTVEPDVAPAPTTRDFTDSVGRVVTIPINLERIAPTGQISQMMLYSVKPEVLVGWSTKLPGEAIAYMPEAVSGLPVFGQFYGKNANLNLEALLASSPQVIIDIGDKKPTHKEDMDALQEQLGIPVIFIEADLNTFPSAYRTLGNLFECEEKTELQASFIEKTLADAAELRGKIAAPKSVYIGTSPSGLDCNAKGSIHADVVEIAGAVNAIEVAEVSNKGGGNTVNLEQLLKANPDVMLFYEQEAYDRAMSDTAWGKLKAVKNKTAYIVPTGPFNWISSPPGVNRIIGIKWLGNLLYPELYDIDMKAEAQTFYKLFWGYDLTDAEYSTINLAAKQQ